MRPRRTERNIIAAIPSRVKMPTMSWVVRLAYMIALSRCGRARGFVDTRGAAFEELGKVIVFRGRHFANRTVESHTALIHEGDAVGELEDGGDVVADHHGGKIEL